MNTGKADHLNKKDFIKFLKDTPTLPPFKPSSKGEKASLEPENKENVCSQNQLATSQYCHQEKEKKTRGKNNRAIQEADFSKIGEVYVLDGTSLRKKYQYEDQVIKKNSHKVTSCPSISPKQIVKLEYLEEMNLLKPEEKQILKQYRRKNPQKAPKNSQRKQQYQGYHPFSQFQSHPNQYPYMNEYGTSTPKQTMHTNPQYYNQHQSNNNYYF